MFLYLALNLNSEKANQWNIEDEYIQETTKIDFSKPNSVLKTLCSNCSEGEKIVSFNKVDSSITIKHEKPRTEVATYRIHKNRDIEISWEMKLRDLKSDADATVMQVIGWQKECFTGGNYHLRVNRGNWEIWVRNIDGNSRDLILPKVVKENVWIKFKINTKLSPNEGYFKLYINDEDSSFDKSIIKNSRTYIDCKLGPYLKWGAYGKEETHMSVSVKNAYIKYL